MVLEAAEHVLEGHLDQRVDRAEALLGQRHERLAGLGVVDVGDPVGDSVAARVELGRRSPRGSSVRAAMTTLAPSRGGGALTPQPPPTLVTMTVFPWSSTPSF